MSRVGKDEWEALWRGIRELSAYFPAGVVFIGGIAVYLHAVARQLPSKWIEFSHDGDLYISLVDFSDLRDLEEVTPNRRLQKLQFIKDGMEFDVYVENNNGLRVPYKDIVSASLVVDSTRIASLEHLLVLKLDAFAARRGSAKGRKDERDLIRLAHMLAETGVNKKRLRPFLTADMVSLLGTIVSSTEFVAMSPDSMPRAGKLRSEFVKVFGEVRAASKG